MTDEEMENVKTEKTTQSKDKENVLQTVMEKERKEEREPIKSEYNFVFRSSFGDKLTDCNSDKTTK